MDTGSHLLFGATLAGLAYLDPVVADHAALAHAVFWGTLVGSHAPDFDTVARLKGYPAYIRTHRGISHSVPALFIWPLLISALMVLLFGLERNGWHLYLWIWIAVVFHVLLDSFNAYGVQSLRPWKKKWVALDVLSLFEPFLFALHAAGLILWLAGAYKPADIFVWVYGVTLMYIAARTVHHYVHVSFLKKAYPQSGPIHVIPTFHWFYWLFVVETEDMFYTGKIVYGQIRLINEYSKESENPAIKATRSVDGVRSFLQFAQRVYVTCKEVQDGYVVRWSDVRFWYPQRLAFGVDVMLDKDFNIVEHRLGWRKKTWEPPYM
ncbi:metal-dependent hydrolase [Ferviditalea candida]|uniref:Metal-dependent hydrolase n=1 Tax=Ferviditalea candida TaxID=3108399 RepID=A0ABU5ZMN8_9BACL|nr:metal-dependent hydrolase [Paenibacillaceae bacterium T2]